MLRWKSVLADALWKRRLPKGVRRKQAAQSTFTRPMRLETLEDRRMLAVVTVGNTLDLENGDTSSIANLIASDGGDGISLREAITAANNTANVMDADTITFDPNIFDGGASSLIRLNGTELAITESLIIDASGAIDVTITGDMLGNDTVVTGTNITDVDASLMSNVISLDDNSRVINFSAMSGDLTLNSITITGGRTTEAIADGGGILTFSGNLSLTNSTVSGNSTTGNEADGGGIYTYSGDVNLTGSTVSGNSTTGDGADGGGIYASTGNLSLTNSTVSGNSTTGNGSDGGGIFSFSGDVILNSSTIVGNTAGGIGGGVFLSASFPAPESTIENSIIADNADNGTAPDLQPNSIGTLTANFSLIENIIGLNAVEEIAFNEPANGNLTGMDPLLGPLADNGGPTFTHALLAGSPAIDAGDPAIAFVADEFDQRGAGFPRVVDGDSDATAVIDIGAFEGFFLPVEVEITLNPENELVISDIAMPAGADNDLTLAQDGDELVITSTSRSVGTTIAGSSGDGTPSVRVPLAAIAGNRIIANLGDGDDRLTVDFTSEAINIPIEYNGEAPSVSPGDELVIAGLSANTITHLFTSPSDGSVSIDFDGGGVDSTIEYTGLEPVMDNLSAVNRIFTFLGGAETITLDDDATANDGFSTIDSTLGESVTFATPTASLTINAGTGVDIVNVDGVDGQSVIPNLIVNGDAAGDTIDLTGIASGAFGNIQLNGDAGDDTIIGSSGADTIDGGADDDSISGGAGNDTIFATLGADTVAGDAGADDITVAPTTSPIFIDGDAPTIAPGDTLTVDLAGTIGASLISLGTGAGILTFLSGEAPISFVDIEDLDFINGNLIFSVPTPEFVDLVNTTDNGRNDTDDVTNLATPTFNIVLDDDQFGAFSSLALVPDTVDDNAQTLNNGADTPIEFGIEVFNNGLSIGFAFLTGGNTWSFTAQEGDLLQGDGNHISAAVWVRDEANPDLFNRFEMSPALQVELDLLAPPVSFGLDDATNATDGLFDGSDTGVATDGATFSDRVTSDTAPTLWGIAEANSIITLWLDANGDGLIQSTGPAADIFLGQTVANPSDGNSAFPPGFWQISSVVDLNDLTTINATGGAFVRDGLRSLLVSSEDLAGNVNLPSLDAGGQQLDILLDTQGPRVSDVQISGSVGFDLFDPKPSQNGPTPLINALTIDFIDQPNRLASDFIFSAVDPTTAENPGNYSLVGDQTGIIPIQTVAISASSMDDGQPANATVTLTFFEPLPDDRFTLTVSDSISDPVGNRLDGESNADEPQADPAFPSGDGVAGGPFVGRFTVDTRPEIGVWAGGIAQIDINGNLSFDPENVDATNRDINFQIGFASDNIFAGQFGLNPVTELASGFDTLAAYGRVGNQWRWLIDTNHDGTITPGVDIITDDVLGINGVPVAGNFDGNAANGDEIGVFNGTTWFLDSNRNFVIDPGDTTVAANYLGFPIVGDFNGDGVDDLGAYSAVTNQFGGNLVSIDTDLDGAFDVQFRVGTAGGNANGFNLFPGVRERAVAADFDADGIDDVGFWVPDGTTISPSEQGEWFFLVSGGNSLLDRVDSNFIAFTPTPFGPDFSARFGNSFAVPVVGNFDPPVVAANGQVASETLTVPENNSPANENEVVSEQVELTDESPGQSTPTIDGSIAEEVTQQSPAETALTVEPPTETQPAPTTTEPNNEVVEQASPAEQTPFEQTPVQQTPAVEETLGPPTSVDEVVDTTSEEPAIRSEEAQPISPPDEPVATEPPAASPVIESEAPAGDPLEPVAAAPVLPPEPEQEPAAEQPTTDEPVEQPFVAEPVIAEPIAAEPVIEFVVEIPAAQPASDPQPVNTIRRVTVANWWFSSTAVRTTTVSLTTPSSTATQVAAASLPADTSSSAQLTTPVAAPPSAAEAVDSEQVAESVANETQPLETQVVETPTNNLAATPPTATPESAATTETDTTQTADLNESLTFTISLPEINHLGDDASVPTQTSTTEVVEKNSSAIDAALESTAEDEIIHSLATDDRDSAAFDDPTPRQTAINQLAQLLFRF